MQKITPFIWFKDNAEEAMNFYVNSFKDGKIIQIERYTGDYGIPNEKELKGKVLTGIFEIMGQRFMCLDGGDNFKLTAGISFLVEYETQEEIDDIWEKLLVGGTAMQCGWITDKFGVTWQITPKFLNDVFSDPNVTDSQKRAVNDAMMPMVKLDLAKLKEAYDSAE